MKKYVFLYYTLTTSKCACDHNKVRDTKTKRLFNKFRIIIELYSVTSVSDIIYQEIPW